MKSLFMIGIGGMGMAPLALYLRSGGHKISGYDDNISSPISKLLEKNDINIEIEEVSEFTLNPLHQEFHNIPKRQKYIMTLNMFNEIQYHRVWYCFNYDLKKFLNKKR